MSFPMEVLFSSVAKENRVESNQNWLFKGKNWTQCCNYVAQFSKLPDGTCRGVPETFEEAGYFRQIHVRRGTWKLLEGSFSLWVHSGDVKNPVAYQRHVDLPIYVITVLGEHGLIGTVYIENFPDLLVALDQFHGLLSLFEGIATKPQKPE